MSFKSNTYRVLIASPSDLPEEREAATEAVNEWNAQHATAESVVLLPVKWETHATPRAGIRPQEALNRQLVQGCDILVGMFWTKLGTDTGVAESGTVEEIAQFVAAGKPAILYFSKRPIDPDKIDARQHQRLRKFKAATYKKALVGSFSRVDELRQTLLRDLVSVVRELRAQRPSLRGGFRRLEEANRIIEIILKQRKHRISREQFEKYREKLLRRRTRTAAETMDPPPRGERGPNGGRIGYLPNGDKVEWVKEEDEKGKIVEWPLLLRRNDKAILSAYNEFWDKVWWNRHQNWKYRIQAGQEILTKERKALYRRAERAARRIERRYGKKNLGWDDFEWGLLSGRMSALAWVTGADWNESLDT